MSPMPSELGTKPQTRRREGKERRVGKNCRNGREGRGRMKRRNIIWPLGEIVIDFHQHRLWDEYQTSAV